MELLLPPEAHENLLKQSAYEAGVDDGSADGYKGSYADGCRHERERIARQLEPLLQVPSKSILEDFAYLGPPSKHWIKSIGSHIAARYEGYNEALKELQTPLRRLLQSLKEQP